MKKQHRPKVCVAFFVRPQSCGFICIGIVKYLDLFIKMWYTNTAKPT